MPVSAAKVAKGLWWEAPWGLSNVILGVSVENQKAADERIPHLVNTPATCRMVSYEPVLGPVEFGGFRHGRQCDGHPAHLCDEACCYTSRIDWP